MRWYWLKQCVDLLLKNGAYLHIFEWFTTCQQEAKMSWNDHKQRISMFVPFFFFFCWRACWTDPIKIIGLISQARRMEQHVFAYVLFDKNLRFAIRFNFAELDLGVVSIVLKYLVVPFSQVLQVSIVRGYRTKILSKIVNMSFAVFSDCFRAF